MTRTALIIEDDALIALELEDIVHTLGLRIVGTAATEQQAVTGAQAQRPDLLLVDVRLAQGNGISAVARILAGQNARVVYVTGNRDEVKKRDPNAICVNKPFNRQTVEQAIRSAFDGAGGAGPTGGPGGATPASSGPSAAFPRGKPEGRSSRPVPRFVRWSDLGPAVAQSVARTSVQPPPSKDNRRPARPACP